MTPPLEPSPDNAPTLPAPYDAWLLAILGRRVTGEPRSSCADCAMCGDSPGLTFRPDVKCCGTWPVLPNFQAGAALTAGGLAAETVRARIADKVAVTPLGLRVPPAVAMDHHEAEFGSDPALICPHFTAEQTCAIWAHRNAVCSTWFCRVERGVPGQLFWVAVLRLIESTETILSRWAAREAGAEPPRGWGPWAADAEGLYRACAERVNHLSWPDIRRLGGFELTVRVREVLHAARALADPSPTTELMPAPVRESHDLPGGGRRLRTWSPYDFVDLDASTAKALAADQPGSVDKETLSELVDHRVWIERV